MCLVDLKHMLNIAAFIYESGGRSWLGLPMYHLRRSPEIKVSTTLEFFSTTLEFFSTTLEFFSTTLELFSTSSEL
jgi:hypothetical protein